MAKTIIKELIIILLLCLAIILLLGILLYEYVPMAKTVPNTVSYVTPEDIKKELAKTQEVEEYNIVNTYEVNANDLNNYKKIQNYRPGKANPFSSYAVSPDNGGNTGNNNSGGSSTGNNSTTEGTTGNGQTQQPTQSSGGKFFNDKGTK